jgi:hypothetical protein
MRFVMFKGEKTVVDLAKRLFVLKGRGSAEATKQAADALLNANPQLRDLTNVPPGSLVAVPDQAPAIAPEELTAAFGVGRSLTSQTVQDAFDSLQQRIGEIEVSSAGLIKTALDRIQTPEFKAALQDVSEQNPELTVRLPVIEGVTKDSKELLTDLESGPSSRKQSVTDLKAALASFAKK